MFYLILLVIKMKDKHKSRKNYQTYTLKVKNDAYNKTYFKVYKTEEILYN